MNSGREALSFTFVSFPKDDIAGELLAWISLVPMGFFVIQFAILISENITARQRTTAALIFLGQLLNEILSYKLKDVFQEFRPNGTERDDYGMPSSHSQFMGFLLGIFPHLLTLTVFGRLPKLLSYILAISGSILVCFSRIYLKYHSLRQVLVGLLLGVFLGSIWSELIEKVNMRQKLKSN